MCRFQKSLFHKNRIISNGDLNVSTLKKIINHLESLILMIQVSKNKLFLKLYKKLTLVISQSFLKKLNRKCLHL
jgi:hypothetical protein